MIDGQKDSDRDTEDNFTHTKGLGPLRRCHFSTRRRRRITKTNSADEFPEDELVPEDELLPEDEF